MNIVIRADASSFMGIGHIMRCLTLANALKNEGHSVRFICRAHSGHLGEKIIMNGHKLSLLPAPQNSIDIRPSPFLEPPHKNWLGADWQVDFEQSREAIGKISVDWLVVDHYALDERWESSMRSLAQRILVIDDLADRSHDCDVLLDQTYGRQSSSYKDLVPKSTKLIMGATYALLRPEFSEFRTKSLTRRSRFKVKNILISLGGVDNDNITSNVLECIQKVHFEEHFKVIVVLGPNAPNTEKVKKQISNLPYDVELFINTSNMAKLMSNADLAIGAAGSTSWERCALGLPTIMVVLAENQRLIANELSASGAAIIIDKDKLTKLSTQIEALDEAELSEMSNISRKICDGSGVRNILAILERAY